jgi:hypothetical protein
MTQYLTEIKRLQKIAGILKEDSTLTENDEVVTLIFKVGNQDIPIQFNGTFSPSTANKEGGQQIWDIKLKPTGDNAKYLDSNSEYSMQYNKTRDKEIFDFQPSVFKGMIRSDSSFDGWLAQKIANVNKGAGSDLKGASIWNSTAIKNAVAQIMANSKAN